MLFRIDKAIYRLYSTVILSKIMNNQKCYFRQQEDKVDITFMLEVKGSARQFNFSRNSTESLQVLLTRMKTNIQKAIDKGNKKNKVNPNSADIKLEFYDSNNVIIDESNTCRDLFSIIGPVKLKVSDNFYEVVFNSPWVLSVNLPQSILAGFPVYPINFETQYAKREKCTFNWYKGLPLNEKGNLVSEQHIQWEFASNNYIYTPSTQEVGMKLKFECIPGNDELVGPAVESISKNLVEAGPGRCPFETRHLFTKQKLKHKSFRCVSYNILADLYCDSDHTRTFLYPYCPAYALHIDYRKQLILKELFGYNGDLICLQEVDSKIFQSTLQPLMDTEGLNGLFYKKGKQVAEGLSCFYRRDRFKFLGDDCIVLSDALKSRPCLQTIWEKIKDNKPLTDRLLDRSTVASATFLHSIDNPDEILIVGNTHLYFHPDADHIRLLQGGAVIYWLMEILDNMRSKYPNKRISVILCGDFNSVPSCGIYQLYTTGASPSSLPDWKSNINEAVYDLNLQQNIPLGSACGTPVYTNYTAGFADCLDYIFYDKANLDVEQVVPLPSVDELKLHTALPSVVFPSDHIALVSDLHFK
ncbi:2',5'-phosphodiesterase 12 [Spodoptera frugiperda]|uniref:2',5'-phosphodiesterase 12 n=1 Tax=Spodoptera frugiperda TaxID=7108 RepID=A0A9R0DAK5_SPOFR|nr:2',5'-phosphodiesterase 12 [Spodoptera frugiperda]